MLRRMSEGRMEPHAQVDQMTLAEVTEKQQPELALSLAKPLPHSSTHVPQTQLGCNVLAVPAGICFSSTADIHTKL